MRKPRELRAAPGHDRESNSVTAYADHVHVPLLIRRLAYRVAFRVLQVFWLFRRPATSGVKCVVSDGNRILLVTHTYGNRNWDFPGGGVKRDEEPLVAAQREMLEELGIERAEWSKLGEVRKNVDHRRDTVHCFRAELASPEVVLNLAELAAAEWFDRERLPGKLAPYVESVLEHLPRTPAR
jgi:8-oxo-dGTP pyrophosphatase MutT (NUDIX family)